MARGFIADFAHGRVAVSTWVEGPPHPSFWQGTKVPADKCVPTATFRCGGCGFLVTYARPEFSTA